MKDYIIFGSIVRFPYLCKLPFLNITSLGKLLHAPLHALKTM